MLSVLNREKEREKGREMEREVHVSRLANDPLPITGGGGGGVPKK